MAIQERNDEAQDLAFADYASRDEFYQDGARLLTAVQAAHRQGGGRLRWGWMADSPSLFGAGMQTTLTETGITDADYAATVNGGPYVDLDGTTEYLNGGDQTWAEPGGEEFFVWHWVYLQSVTLAAHEITSKWDTGQAEWALSYNQPVNQNYRFDISPDGAASTFVASSYAQSRTGQWLFVAAYYQPSTLLRIFVGAASETSLTIDSNVAGIPATIFTGTSSFRIGDIQLAGNFFWNGEIGIGAGRCNVPAASINAYATRLFQMTRWFYQA